MIEYTAEELEGMPNVEVDSAFMIPQGYLLKIGGPFKDCLLFNPQTKHVQVFRYWESPCYGVSADDIQYNGHYDLSQTYTAKEK